MAKRDYSPFLPQTGFDYTVKGVNFRTSTANFEEADDLYKSITKAEERAYNLGCAGYRQVTTNDVGAILYGPCNSLTTYTEIVKQIKPEQRHREYYAFDPTDNLFDVRDSINDENIKNGFDYREQIFSRTMSTVMFRDPRKVEILNSIQKVVFALIESVKQIRNSINYTVPYNNKRVF